MKMFAAGIFVVIASFAFLQINGCPTQNSGDSIKAAISGVEVAAPKGIYLRCRNIETNVVTCRNTETCEITEVQMSEYVIFDGLTQCATYQPYYICQEPITLQYSCTKDYLNCSAPFPVHYNASVLYDTLADCNNHIPRPWIRCKSGSDPVCRYSACNSGETQLNGLMNNTFTSLDICNANLYNGRPCYIPADPVLAGTGKYYVITSAFDHLGGTCPAGGVLLSSTYLPGSTPTLVNAATNAYYSPTTLITHYRCFQWGRTPVCRPNMGTASFCPTAEIRLTATEPISWDSLGNCTNQLYYNLMCHSFTDSGNGGSICPADTDNNGCPGGYRLVASFSNSVAVNPSACTSNNVLWVRCQSGASTICRPQATGCAAAETLVQPVTGLLLSDCQNTTLAYRKCYNTKATVNLFQGQTPFQCTTAPCTGDDVQVGLTFSDPTQCNNYNPDYWIRCENAGKITCRPNAGSISCISGETQANPVGAEFFSSLATCLIGPTTATTELPYCFCGTPANCYQIGGTTSAPACCPSIPQNSYTDFIFTSNSTCRVVHP